MAKRGRRKSKYTTFDEVAKEIVDKGIDTPANHSHYNRGERVEKEIVLDIRPFPIAWGIPMDEILYAKFLPNLLGQIPMPWDAVLTTESTYLPSARNEIHRQFLKTDCSYLMMLDSDILSPPGMVRRLLTHQKDLVGGWYKNKNLKAGPHPIVYDYVYENEEGYFFRHRKEPGHGLERVDGMGAGCWLMSRELAEALGECPYSMHKATEDLNLSKKIIDLGFEMWVDWDLACAHMGVSWV